MGWIKERLKQEIEKSRQALGREPKVICFEHAHVAGQVSELHEDGMILRGAERLMEGIDGTQVKTLSLPPSPFSDRVFHTLGSGVWWVVEEEQSRVIVPPKDLVVPR